MIGDGMDDMDEMDGELETRLRAELRHRVEAVDPDLAGPELRRRSADVAPRSRTLAPGLAAAAAVAAIAIAGALVATSDSSHRQAPPPVQPGGGTYAPAPSTSAPRTTPDPGLPLQSLLLPSPARRPVSVPVLRPTSVPRSSADTTARPTGPAPSVTRLESGRLEPGRARVTGQVPSSSTRSERVSGRVTPTPSG